VAHNLIAAPERYDIILTTNLFGDILSDEAAALVSGLVPTGNFSHEAAVFLPVNHNPRYEEVGRNIVNPLPIILCGAMMLGRLGELQAGLAVEAAVKQVLAEGSCSGNTGTAQVTAMVCDRIAL
jgi:isocitrate/isopropylmalate dehydrogenase